MSNASSPTKYSSDIYDPNFTQEINSKMRVPKKIKVDGSNGDDMGMGGYLQWNGNSEISSKMNMPKRINVDGPSNDDITIGFSSDYTGLPGNNDKVDMQVPDRIILLGQERTYGTTAPPREILVENQVLPQDPGYIRVQTPPRVITLDSDEFNSRKTKREEEEEEEQNLLLHTPVMRRQMPSTSQDMVPRVQMAESTPVLMNATVREEITHLRNQMAKQNRRLVNVEYQLELKNQRDKIISILTVSYLLLKALYWLGRD